MTYQTLLVEKEEAVAWVKINNPSRANAMQKAFWEEMPKVFEALDADPTVRVIVIKGEGKHFSAGIDLEMFQDTFAAMQSREDPGRTRERFRREVLAMQETFTCIERCQKPVIAAIHGACIGGGIDLITACDLRYASKEAYFSVKEIDIGIVADVGTLQRLPKVIPAGTANELAFTGRNFSAEEAERFFLVNKCYEDSETLFEEVAKLAQSLAAKSPLALRGTKRVLLHSRDHSVSEGLDYVATWNAAMIFSYDLLEIVQATAQKRAPKFAD